MSADYKSLRQQADRLFYRFNDKVDDKAAAAGLAREIRDVVEDFEMQKKPRSIEDRIKRIQQQLQNLNDSVMDHADSDELHDGYEDIRRDLRQLSNY